MGNPGSAIVGYGVAYKNHSQTKPTVWIGHNFCVPNHKPGTVWPQFCGLAGTPDVLLQEVEIAVGPFSITAEREAVVDYTQAFMEDGAGIVMKKLSPHADDMVRIFLPFHYHVWYSICSTVLFMGEAGCDAHTIYLICLSFERPYLMKG